MPSTFEKYERNPLDIRLPVGYEARGTSDRANGVGSREHLDSTPGTGTLEGIWPGLPSRIIGVPKRVASQPSTSGPASFGVVDPDGNPVLLDRHA